MGYILRAYDYNQVKVLGRKHRLRGLQSKILYVSKLRHKCARLRFDCRNFAIRLVKTITITTTLGFKTSFKGH